MRVFLREKLRAELRIIERGFAFLHKIRIRSQARWLAVSVAGFTEFLGGRTAGAFKEGTGMQILSTRHGDSFFMDSQSPPRTRKNPCFSLPRLKSNSRINVGKLCIRRKALCTSSKYRINMNKAHFD